MTGSQKKNGTGTGNLKNQDTILNVLSGVLHFVGDSLIRDTIDGNLLELPRQSSYQCDQSSTPSYGDNVFSDESDDSKLGLDFQHSFSSFKIIYQVPCILGVNLTDVDQLEFIQQ
ncbi:hypothetical protein AABB24_022948 [Solanum stoloniferum]|uniref:Uncharacterized protein n=1 Tax=Solanum stoloniferum TaxID=62892 RepID=A0ABD2T1W2_9SOLN